VAGAPQQTTEVVNGVKLSISVYASIPFLLCCVLLFFYTLNKVMETRIEKDLSQRRAGPAAV
jgi:Na+/melibiose symporter-like transporter